MAFGITNFACHNLRDISKLLTNGRSRMIHAGSTLDQHGLHRAGYVQDTEELPSSQ
jgi:hypothetical protein